jgi:hypothetical protein
MCDVYSVIFFFNFIKMFWVLVIDEDELIFVVKIFEYEIIYILYWILDV